MGTLVGHVAPGLAFCLLGVWHLFNHTKLHSQNPTSYFAHPWFPTSKLKHVELYLIMAATSISVAMELFIGPERHQPLDPDGTIPSNHLHNFEHASISAAFFTYAALSIVLDWARPKAQFGLTQLLGAVAFGQQLLMFRLHSSDHVGVEGQYHLLLQSAIAVSLVTTLMGIGLPRSFMVSFVRSTSVFFQGVWMVVMGYALWTPSLVAKGCFINEEEGHKVVRCSGEEALHRAKSLVNIQFSWLLIAVAAFVVGFYLVLHRLYGRGIEYTSLMTMRGDQLMEDSEDVESQKNGPMKSFIQMGKISSWGKVRDNVER
ncbi:unnamed protein product [Linum trigynum]|uniref:Uncharacterized protein n=1 Tax=Linum trigynum TaxID=586398 RepID=A0AAV2EL23_9ROSI